MGNKKVYCSECKWLSETFSDECCHPKNEGNWYSRTEYKEKAPTLNKNNDCKWHEPE